MKNLSLSNTFNVCGFYELDAAGTILYSRPKHDGKFEKPDASLIGLNFFEKVLVCQNSENLRRRFAGFVSGRTTADSFIFSCQISGSLIPLRVMFVRVSERNSGAREVLFYIDIKPN